MTHVILTIITGGLGLFSMQSKQSWRSINKRIAGQDVNKWPTGVQPCADILPFEKAIPKFVVSLGTGLLLMPLTTMATEFVVSSEADSGPGIYAGLNASDLSWN